PPSLSSLRPEIPEPVSDFVLTCLAKQPEQRFADMSELRAALDALPSVTLAAGAGVGGIRSSMPPTEVLDRPEPAGQSTVTAFVDPPTAVVEAAFGGHPRRTRRRRPATGSFDQPLDSERSGGWLWVAVVVVLAAAAAGLYLLS